LKAIMNPAQSLLYAIEHYFIDQDDYHGLLR